MPEQRRQDDETLSPDQPSSPAPVTLPPTQAGNPSASATPANARPTSPVQPHAAHDAPQTRITAGGVPQVDGHSSGTFPIVPGYVILREIGRGGMGVVYHAVQTRLNRPVALKMILAGAHAGPVHRARFQIEAESLAGLQHPNIVQLYEIGEHEHCPYLAMEFLDGESLDRHIKGKPQPFDSSAQLIEALSRAIHCAHLRGIVHRDLKPGNILIGADFGGRSAEMKVSSTVVTRRDGLDASSSSVRTLRSPLRTPKLLDFGLAKRLEGESCTNDGAVMGTPSYMAPEQAMGKVREIGPAADVYALGAILYELLTGRPPFVAETVIQTLLKVQNEEPIRPSRLRPRMPRDLEVICLKCLEKDPSKRYVSAEALADDLHAFLAREPIHARPVGVGERAWKWARRRPAIAALVAVSTLAALGFVGIGIWYNGRLREANVNLKAARDRAEERSRLVRTAVDEMYTQVAEKWLGNEPHMDALQEEFLNKARRLYEELARDESDDPVLQAETARAHFRIGQIYHQLNKFAEAETAYATAIAEQELVIHRVPGETTYRRDLANSYNFLGELRRVTDPRKAVESYAKALELQRDLVREHNGEPEYRKDEARSHLNLGIARSELNDLVAARTEMESAISLLEPLAQPNQKDRSYRQELARVYLNLGKVLATPKDNGAESAYEKAIQLQRALQEADPKQPEYRYELAVSLNNLGNLSQSQKKQKQALANHEEARTLLERLTMDFPSRPLYRKELANTCNSLAAGIYQTEPQKAADLWKQAEKEFRNLAETWKKVPKYRHGQGQASGNRGWVLMKELKQPGAALPLLKEAVNILEDVYDCNTDNHDFYHALMHQRLNLSECLLLQGDYDEMERVLGKMLNLKPVAPEPQRFYAASLLADCAAKGNRNADADWAVRVLEALDPARLSEEQRALTDEKFAALRGRPDVQQLLLRWKAAQVKQGRQG